ncbi:hypothetical protein FTO74_05840 [Granulicella sp. WH15]|uniref:anti-sigma factor family protein n=1 Tax=Granulicella sp. WH15 TaxID=2602070 RepID=UPI001366B7F6|nr:hypothetical protein [Granulicella sp. WH15]QHN02944.1 hypothetical protein FTO74_05840 [Granulicella sp. WH15]
MKPFNENDLIAYHLHELSPGRARALEQTLRVDPSLASESEAYAAMLRSFKGGVPLEISEEIVERNWRSVWSKLPRQPLRPVRFSRWLLPTLAGLGLAFAATSLFITTQHHADRTSTLHRPNDMVQSKPPSQDSLSTDATAIASNANPRSLRRKPVLPDVPLSASPNLLLYNVPPRILSSIPDLVEPAPVLRFIPLARGPVPSSLTLDLPPIAIQPATPSQIPGSDSSSKHRRQRNAIHREHPIDVTLAMGGILIGTRDVHKDETTYSQGATHAISAIASFHQQLRPAVGYRVAVSYARPDFLYGYRTAFTSTGTDLNQRIYEVAGTYVLQGPHHGIVSTVVEGGAGLMGFLPTKKNSGTGTSLRGSVIVGASADLAVTKHLAIHTSYRMQIFKGPDFQSTDNAVPAVSTTLISNEPMVGITYRFSHK